MQAAVTDQVNQYIAEHGTFNANQLVLINGGANDIFYWAAAYQKTAAAVQAGTQPPSDLAAVQSQATAAMTLAAQQFIGAVQLIRSMLYGTEPLDPTIYAAVAGLLLMVAAIACMAPAWRASRLDPMQALRME